MAWLGSVITGVSLIIVQMIISFKSQRLQDLKFDMMIKEVRKDIERLEKKQDKHNDVITRVALLEKSDEDQWKRLEDIIEKIKEQVHD